MSRWFGRVGRKHGGHERARELSAERMDGPLTAADQEWLAQHLDACDGCRSAAADYEAQRSALRALGATRPEPPRDLWARTAAAIDALGKPSARPYQRLRLPVGPAAALLVIGLAVVGVLNGRSALLPGSGAVAEATPIAVPGGVLQLIGRGEDGSVEILSRQLDQVCPMGTTSCGLSGSMDVTQSAHLEGDAQLSAVISPTDDRLVVMERGAGPQRLYVLPVRRPDVASPPPTSPGPSATAGGSGSPVAESTPPASGTAPASGTPKPPDASGTPTPTTEPAETPSASPIAPPSEPPSGEPTSEPPSSQPTSEPSSTQPASSPEGSEAPTPAPTVVVSPGPDGALEIASDVTVVGSAAGYSDDGSSFAFSARPADDSAGPDVFLWQAGDARAVAVTTDHASVFNGWLGNRLLISRIVDGDPVTVTLDPETGDEAEVGDASMWRPTVSPDGSMAAWWDGTVKPVDGGRMWVPGKGRLVLGPWPSGDGHVQVLANGPIGDWDVLWDQDASAVAVWISPKGPDDVGRLSLYPVDGKSGLADLKHPVLEDAAAYDSISLRPGHLAWSAPDPSGDTSVDVLAWQGDTFGRLQLSTIGGASVVR